VEITDGSLQTDPSGDPLDDLGDGRRSRGAIERSAAVVASRTSERAVDVASVVNPEHRHGLPALSIVMRSEIHDEPTDEVGGRHLLPPRTTVVEAERHGVLDAADGKVRKDLYVTLGERDAFTFESIGVPESRRLHRRRGHEPLLGPERLHRGVVERVAGGPGRQAHVGVAGGEREVQRRLDRAVVGVVNHLGGIPGAVQCHRQSRHHEGGVLAARESPSEPGRFNSFAPQGSGPLRRVGDSEESRRVLPRPAAEPVKFEAVPFDQRL
jgi:hypothetical protein